MLDTLDVGKKLANEIMKETGHTVHNKPWTTRLKEAFVPPPKPVEGRIAYFGDDDYKQHPDYRRLLNEGWL